MPYAETSGSFRRPMRAERPPRSRHFDRTFSALRGPAERAVAPAGSRETARNRSPAHFGPEPVANWKHCADSTLRETFRSPPVSGSVFSDLGTAQRTPGPRLDNTGYSSPALPPRGEQRYTHPATRRLVPRHRHAAILLTHSHDPRFLAMRQTTLHNIRFVKTPIDGTQKSSFAMRDG